MYTLIKSCLILFFLFLFEATYSQSNDFKIVAVGSAGIAKENMLITYDQCSQSATMTKNLQALSEITRNDFAFYSHILNVQMQPSGNVALSLANLKEVTSTNPVYWLHWKCHSRTFELLIYSLVEQKEKYRSEWKNINDVNRSLAHQFNDLAFQALFQKKSIFNSKIVFSGAIEWSSRRSVKEIYMVDFDGYNLNRITQHRGLALAPAFSPDNKKIIYSLIDSKKIIKNVELRELDLQTGNSKIISSKVGMNSGAVYAEDGKGIYATLTFKGNADIYYIDLATGSERAITSSFAEDVDPSITKDGKLLTFLSNRAGKAHVYTLDPSSVEKDIRRISFVGKFNATPRFSPDGSEIVFSSWVDNGFDLYRLSISGQSIVRLTKNHGSNEDPTYSEDGQFIVFSSRKSKRGDKDLDQKLFIMNRDGEILGALTQNFKLCSSPRLSN
jgi:TolB protein